MTSAKDNPALAHDPAPGLLFSVFRASQRVGFPTTVACVIAWLVCGAIAVRASTGILWQVPLVGMVIGWALAFIVAIGGLLCFWTIAMHIRYRRRGFGMRWVTGAKWVYEERVSSRESRTLTCERRIVGGGYPAPSEVRILSEAAWESEAPPWARGRRSEITQRIAKCFGADQGGNVQFVDA